MCWKFECRYDIHYKTQTGTSCEKCGLQGLPAENRTLLGHWITRTVLYHSTDSVADNLGASAVYIIMRW